MKRLLLLSLLFIICMSLVQTNVEAKVPHVLNYQAQLLDANNQPLNKTVPVEFKIYNSEYGGSPLWLEIQDVTAAAGFVNVYLGTINPINLPFDEQYWLEVKIGNGTPYPRTRMTSVGQSIHSFLADTAEWAQNVTENGVKTFSIANEAVTQEKLAPGVQAIPWGTAGGDLAGNYPNPTLRPGAVIDNIEDGSITQNKLGPNVTTPPSGPASGDLTGEYPDPLIAVGAVKTDRIYDQAVTTEKIADYAVTGIKIAEDAVGPFQLDETGVYAGTYGDRYNVGQFTVDEDGRIMYAMDVTIGAVSNTYSDIYVGDDDINNLNLQIMADKVGVNEIFAYNVDGYGKPSSMMDNGRFLYYSYDMNDPNQAKWTAAPIDGTVAVWDAEMNQFVWTVPDISFADITSGTNTSATMIVAGDAMLYPEGTGIIRANEWVYDAPFMAYEGYFENLWVSNKLTGGDADLNNLYVIGTLDVDGATNLNNTLDVDGASTFMNTVDIYGATSIYNTLDVDGATTLNSTLDVDGETTLNDILDVDGATTLNSTLDVDGDANFNARVGVDSDYGDLNEVFVVAADGKPEWTLTLDGLVYVNTDDLLVDNSATVTNDLFVDDELDVDGATMLHSTLEVDGATDLYSTLNVWDATMLHSTLLTMGSATFESSVDVYGYLNVDGPTTLNNTLDVDGATTLNDILDVDGATNLHSTLEVDGATDLYSTLDVWDATVLHSTLLTQGSATFESSVDIYGYLNVDGPTTLNNTLDVDGATTLNDILDVDGATNLHSTLEVDGATDLYSTLDVWEETVLHSTLLTMGSATFESSVDVDGYLDVDGPTTLNNTLDVDGATTLNDILDVDGATNLHSTLEVDGATDLYSTLDVWEATTLHSTLLTMGSATFESSVDVDGYLDVDGPTTLNNTLDVDGETTLNDILDVDGATMLHSTLEVDGATDLYSTLDVWEATMLHSTLDVDDNANFDGMVGVDEDYGDENEVFVVAADGEPEWTNTLDGLALVQTTELQASSATITNSLDVLSTAVATFEAGSMTNFDGNVNLNGATDITGTLDLDGNPGNLDEVMISLGAGMTPEWTNDLNLDVLTANSATFMNFWVDGESTFWGDVNIGDETTDFHLYLNGVQVPSTGTDNIWTGLNVFAPTIPLAEMIINDPSYENIIMAAITEDPTAPTAVFQNVGGGPALEIRGTEGNNAFIISEGDALIQGATQITLSTSTYTPDAALRVTAGTPVNEASLVVNNYNADGIAIKVSEGGIQMSSEYLEVPGNTTIDMDGLYTVYSVNPTGANAAVNFPVSNIQTGQIIYVLNVGINNLTVDGLGIIPPGSSAAYIYIQTDNVPNFGWRMIFND